ncbi:MAG: hypothetical protein L0Z54_02465, partial [Thermoplasmata archaeon]|nr:hypothetical protein [Thermoplasmata archaeon]
MDGDGEHSRNDPEVDRDGETPPVFHDFYDLMRRRVHKILLVSSLYDAFTLEEDGLLFEQISGEYRELSLPYPPQIIRVSSGSEALVEMGHEAYDLVVTMAQISDMEPAELGRRVKEMDPDVPVILLLTEMADIAYHHSPGRHDGIDEVFFWSGDSALYLAMIKYLEDKMNIEHDTSTGLVRVLMVVEDSPRYYSAFLPTLYKEIMQQTRALISEGLNEHEQRLRLRSRPKIVLAETFEDAMALYRRYKPFLMGVISDVTFGRDGRREDECGFRLVEEIGDDLPVLLQSSEERHAAMAAAAGIPLVLKRSDTMLQALRAFFRERLGFGDFVFRMPDGAEVGRAADIREFIETVPRVPAESLVLHGRNNDFSNWLMARGEIRLARTLRGRSVSEFASPGEMREYLIESIIDMRRRKQLGVITDFERQDFQFDQTFTRLGGGSIGGKGRGIAFLSALLSRSAPEDDQGGIRVMIPDTLVIGTDEFDRFIDDNGLRETSKADLPDSEIARRFLEGSLHPPLRASLARFLGHVSLPLAVRSSSLLEDSQNQPFAGIYSTYILPNECGDTETRLEQLVQAIKLVYASTFYRRAKAYLRTTGLLPEEEKMAVVIQNLIGNQHGDRFYPLISGVARSHNFYPVHPLRRDDGIASVALGLGKIVVEGERVLSFSPAHPDVVPGFHTPQDIMKNSQRHFYALDMS